MIPTPDAILRTLQALADLPYRAYSPDELALMADAVADLDIQLGDLLAPEIRAA